MRSSLLILLLTVTCAAQDPSSLFPPIDQWKSAVISGNAEALKSIYSSSPPAQVSTIDGKGGPDAAIAFWTGLKAKDMTLSAVEAGSPRPDLQLFTLQVKVKTAGGRTTNVVEGQMWRNQDGVWRIVGEKRDLAKLEQPARVDDHIYPTGDAHADIAQALARARHAHKNVLLVFGADWCYDCHVLDKAFRRPDVASILNSNYELVDIDIGNGDKNSDVAQQYEVPLNRGVPAVAILDADGKLIFSQKGGEWERARGLGPQDLIAFLDKWKPKRG